MKMKLKGDMIDLR